MNPTNNTPAAEKGKFTILELGIVLLVVGATAVISPALKLLKGKKSA